MSEKVVFKTFIFVFDVDEGFVVQVFQTIELIFLSVGRMLSICNYRS